MRKASLTTTAFPGKERGSAKAGLQESKMGDLLLDIENSVEVDYV